MSTDEQSTPTLLAAPEALAALDRVIAYVRGTDAFYDDGSVPDDVLDTADGSPDSPALRLSDLRLLASGVVRDVATLAEDEALMFRMGSIQHDLDPGAAISDSLRTTITRLAAEDTTALAAALGGAR